MYCPQYLTSRLRLLVSCALASAALLTAQSKVPAVQTPSAPRQAAKSNAGVASPALVEAGTALYQQNCTFCHGRDAGGGETGPDLTRSKLVSDDKGGDKIGDILLNGRIEQGMPKFAFSPEQVNSITAFLHKRQADAESRPGGRRGVDEADLKTGNVEAGKLYFNGAGKCNNCHSPEKDLAHVAVRHRGLKLEQRLLYPKDAVAHVTVTPSSGQPIKGVLEYKDEFTIGLKDESGHYRSWPVSKVQFEVDDPAQAHADLLARYSDEDIHNLMAYLQTLR